MIVSIPTLHCLPKHQELEEPIGILYVGKIWRGKVLANGVQFAKIFHANSYKYSEITEDLPADSSKFSSPFASSVMIHLNFLPPKFSHVRYTCAEYKCRRAIVF